MVGPQPVISVEERRARLARRHRLAADHRAGNVVEATDSMVCLHGTDPWVSYLSTWARVDGMTVADLERALYVDRSLVKHLAMRRTLFVFSREVLEYAQAGASARVAAAERRRLVRDVEKAGLHEDGERWLAEAWRKVLAVLSDGRELTSSQLRDEIPLLAGSIAYGIGTEPIEPWPALLPPLDPTTMGWFERDWYLGPYKAQVFDTAGNAGSTVWWDGRIVGGWRQRDNGEVVLQMLQDVGSEGLAAVEHEAARLTEWFAGTRVLPRFPSPLWKAGR